MARPKTEFWLDTKKKIDRELLEQIPILKSKRKFTETIRNGMRLILDLRDGNLDVLFELFPWVRAEFLEYMQKFQASHDIAAELADIKAMLKNQPSSGPVKLAINTELPPPIDDDDDDLLVVKKDEKAGKQANLNFINSLKSLTG